MTTNWRPQTLQRFVRGAFAWAWVFTLAGCAWAQDSDDTAQRRTGCANPVTTHALPLRAENAQRGLWIPTPEHTKFFDSPAEMNRQLSEFQRIGFNTIYVAMWNQGRTLFPSETMRKLTGIPIDEKLSGRDPLKEVVQAAHGKGIRVYAWFEFGFASDYKGGPGSEIIKRNPTWAALDQSGKQVEKNGFRWMNALDPEVQSLLTNLIMEAVKGYDIDGIQGDDRLPAMPSQGGYNPVTVAQYKTEHAGKSPPTNYKDAAWVQWRADQLSGYLQRLYSTVKAVKPDVKVSISPSAFPWGKEEYLQDWPRWVKNGWVDSVSPQIYRYKLDGYRAELKKISRAQLCPEHLARVFPGLLLSLGKKYVADTELIRAMARENRREGFAGEVYFYNEGVLQRASLFEQLYAQP